MDQLGFLEDKKLLSFYHENKTEMSVMENPQIFLNMLKDYNLIPEDKHREVKHVTTKECREEAVYDILEYIEREKRDQIRPFWTCVANEFILSRYPTLKKLHRKLTDEMKMQTKVDVQKNDKNRPIMSSNPDEQQPGQSSQQTAGQKKNDKQKDSFNLIKGLKVLPVTCGNKKGKLTRKKLAEGEKCIRVGDKWYDPSEFEEYGGRESSKNWKTSIKHDGKPLAKLIMAGHLKVGRYARRIATAMN